MYIQSQSVNNFWLLTSGIIYQPVYFTPNATPHHSLQVELEGDLFPLKELADISKKDPKRLILDCSSFPTAASNIVKAIRDSGMNLNPQQEGTRIFVPIPKVTKEYRQVVVFYNV